MISHLDVLHCEISTRLTAGMGHSRHSRYPGVSGLPRERSYRSGTTLRLLSSARGLGRRTEPMSVSDDKPKIPVDIIVDADGCFHALYSDGTLGPVLTIDEMMDTLPLLREVPEAAPES